ncbi:DNA-directed RNA polymerase subunit delta [Enterococcus phoeniculicola]|uniref:Probable DNA-directed RNA polymerase subunit delta n=1 Tax=Enterococcus phoeniculicola ATCC BAA-412 TaxID=1158610 RepID=R3WJY0_9ENTE|nr:DNA-directed RNA polymerase subunit delta [Enterococcus phoeniculicola]EOL42205.1 DNA-directed RNA polymerase subunit delta [Enterococcus phoeniculicola ATCC BAA-412]EOT79516.1 DNA-directed RNA polymerase subunit delta [Enterococcus phoeniculicola ATCC BAA-412]OJG70366.1 DNA-directed RNA polymerase subunit delta [Enterococcus phoeniculicola]
MEINVFKDANKNELSMIEVAHAILEQHEDVMDFSDLVNQIQTYLEKTDSEIRDSLAQFYTDLNIDGSFISLGDNRWGLRSWYAFDSIDEEVNHGLEEEDEDTPKRRKRKKVNAFITGDEDAIDYNDDDPEDADLVDEDDDDLFEDDDEEEEEISAYNTDLKEIGADSDDEEELPGSIEEDLTIIDDDDEDDEEYDDEFEEEEK